MGAPGNILPEYCSPWIPLYLVFHGPQEENFPPWGGVKSNMRYPPKVIGLLQAVGLAAYIGLFASLGYQAQAWVQARTITVHPIAGITLFLLAFVISALISGSIVLAYPALLFFEGRKADAIQIVFWSAVWLVLIFCAAALTALAIALRVIFS